MKTLRQLRSKMAKNPAYRRMEKSSWGVLLFYVRDRSDCEKVEPKRIMGSIEAYRFPDGKEAERILDRLINRHGADTPILDVFPFGAQKKEKPSEATESPSNEGDGGAGTPEDTSPEEEDSRPDEPTQPQDGGQGESQQGHNEPVTDQEGAESSDEVSESGSMASSQGGEESQDVGGCAGDGDDSESGDDPGRNSGDGLAALQLLLQSTIDAPPAMSDANLTASRNLSMRSMSGPSMTLEHLKDSRKDDAKLGRRFTDALRKMIKLQVSTRGDRSPRILPRKLVREIVTKRCNLAATRREELDIRPILLMCDVSGSCSAVCADTLKACLDIQAEMPELVQVVVHSNGMPCEAQGRFITQVSDEWERRIEAYTSHNWAFVVNFGDDDAIDVLQAIHDNGAKIVQFDSFGANTRGVEMCDRHEWLTVNGVNNIRASLEGITLLKKNLRG